jgi:Icc-related predicted phosphoesterase
MLNTLIRAYQPALVCCGGPSEGRGTETIDGARLVNPGSLADGPVLVYRPQSAPHV